MHAGAHRCQLGPELHPQPKKYRAQRFDSRKHSARPGEGQVVLSYAWLDLVSKISTHSHTHSNTHTHTLKHTHAHTQTHTHVHTQTHTRIQQVKQ